MNSLDVLREMTAPSGAIFTLTAFERFFTRMRHNVLTQLWAFVAEVRTMRTLVFCSSQWNTVFGTGDIR